MKKPLYASLHTVLVPVVHGCDVEASLAAARALAPDVLLVGVVRIPSNEPLSAGASKAREVRKLLRQISQPEHIRTKARVIVSHTPWDDLLNVVSGDEPDLLVLDWVCHFDALGIDIETALARPPCDVALVRGPFPKETSRVLVPVRGGPHAELALRLAISLHPTDLIALHLTTTGSPHSDAPFSAIDRVLRRMPEVQARTEITSNPAATLVRQSQVFDLIIMGATAQPLRSRTSLGSVTDRLLNEASSAVLAVKTHRPMPSVARGETVGARAISLLVDKWFAENTFHAGEFADLRHLLTLKALQGVTISLALPALNEEETIGKVIQTIQKALMVDVPLLDEMVVIDSNSTDATRQIARSLGLPVYIHQDLLPNLGARHGKGEALWKSLLVTHGDIIAWIDTDIVNISPRFVYGILGPLLHSRKIQFVKGFYRRPLKVGDKVQAGGGGRVTELTARPLLNLFYPELSGVIQPLSGEYAGRRAALEQLTFSSGYGVETGLLIDMLEKFGLSTIAQVDLLERVHHNQPLDQLSKMSFAILQTVVRKLERRYGQSILDDINRTMKLIRYTSGGYYLEVEEIAERERPAMLEVPDYRKRMR